MVTCRQTWCWSSNWNHKHEAKSTDWKWPELQKPQSLPSDAHPSTRPQLLNLPSSTIWEPSLWGHSYSNHHTEYLEFYKNTKATENYELFPIETSFIVRGRPELDMSKRERPSSIWRLSGSSWGGPGLVRVTAPTVLCLWVQMILHEEAHLMSHWSISVCTRVCMHTCSLVHLRPEEISGVLSLNLLELGW